MNLELYLIEVIKGKRKGFLASFLRIILRMLSWVYQFVVLCRNWAFDHGVLRRYMPPVPMVISIGNIVAGGTGKTPLTLLIAQEFYPDFKIAVLSRGYRSQAEKLDNPIILSQGNGPIHPASYCGDEPYLIAEKLPKAFVIVGKDRHKSSDFAAKAGAQLILLDDGMQHRHLARDVDVVVMDMADPFGQGHFLPRGMLRESLSSLSRASLIVLNHVNSQELFEETKKIIATHTTAPVVGTKMEVDSVCNFVGNLATALKNKKVGIFCGIAQPDNFKQTVMEEEAVVVASHIVPDHMPFDWKLFQKFVGESEAAGAEMLVCTEKDKVKLPPAMKCSLPIVWLKMKLTIVAGETEWKTFIRKTKADIIRQM